MEFSEQNNLNDEIEKLKKKTEKKKPKKKFIF